MMRRPFVYYDDGQEALGRFYLELGEIDLIYKCIICPFVHDDCFMMEWTQVLTQSCSKDKCDASASEACCDSPTLFQPD